MSDRGSETPPGEGSGEGSGDPQSHLRIIPPDPVADSGDADVPAPAPTPPASKPAGGPRVRVFADTEADTDDPALMPLPAMGPGSGGSRIGSEGVEAAPSDAEAVPPDDEPDEPEAPDEEETTVEAMADSEEATTIEQPLPSPEESEGLAEEEESDEAPVDEVDEGASEAIEQPLAARGDPGKTPVDEVDGGVLTGGVRLDRSDTGDIIKVSADQIPREAEGESTQAAGASEVDVGSEDEEAAEPRAGVEEKAAPSSSAAVKIATGVIFGAVALVVVLLGRPAFALLAGLLVVWGAIEFYGALYQSAAEVEQAGAGAAVAELTRRPSAVIAVVAVAAMVVTTFFYGIEATGAMACAALVAALLWFVPETAAATAPRDPTLSALGIVHVGIAGSFSMLILRLEHGFALLLAVVILTIVTDVAAYAWGSNIGHTSFFNSVSPNKSLEGFLGAVATTIVAALVMTGLHGWLYPSVPVLASWGQMFILAVVVAVAATAGDLAESLFKRELGIKDVASFLPGHGGMLDRLDGMLFALPIAYVFFVAMGLADVG